jgi:Nuclease-related domain
MTPDALQFLDTDLNRLILVLMGVAALSGLLLYLFKAWTQRRARTRLHEGIVSTGVEHLQDVLVPDGMGGTMHVDYILLTSRGVVVIDLRDVRGNIFGGDQMTEWTIMSGASRQTFHNPQHALYDRVAAVRQLSGNLVVEGRVLFTRRGKFPKGLPRWTLMVDSLRTEFPAPDSQASASWVDGFREAWKNLVENVSPSPLKRRRSFISEVFN